MCIELKNQVKQQLCLISFHHSIAQVKNVQFLKFQLFNQLLFAAIYLTVTVANQKTLAIFFPYDVIFLNFFFTYSLLLPLKCI